MRMLLLALVLGISVVTAPAYACRIGGDMMIFPDKPSPPEGPRYTTIARVELDSPGPFPTRIVEEGRGFLVGSARVLETIYGPRLPASLPAYLEGVTSCTVSSPNGIHTSGYVVGRLLVDDRGAYLQLSARKEPQGIWK